jgi:lipopolysaccharide biosynthesis regulator YciM
MVKHSTTICGWNQKELKAKHLLRVVENPTYYCKECGRVANKKKWLCLPKKLHNTQP